MMHKIVPAAAIAVLMLSAGNRCRVAAAPPEVAFELSPQTLGSASVHEIGLADLDGDGDLDAVFSDYDQVGILNGVYFNNGNGVFTYSGQSLPMPYSHGLGLADLDGDQDVDVFMTCADEDLVHQSAVFLNNGSGYFTQSPQNIGDLVLAGNDVYVFDIDGDEDIDVLVDYYMEPNKVYENDGHGILLDSGQVYPESAYFEDLDSDGDTDILECDRVVSFGYRTWINDGLGNFTATSFLSNPLIVRSQVGFGDLDDDSDIDAVVTNGNWDVAYPTKILLNDGTGVFTESETELTETYNAKVCVADFNNDSHNDIVIISYGKLNQLYVNDGQGGYTWSEFGNSLEMLSGVPAVGDVNGDDLLDLFSPAFWLGTTQLWFNRTQLPCCVGRTGNTNMQGSYPNEITLGDVSLLIDVKFISGDCGKLICLPEADVNQNGGGAPDCQQHVTLADISALIDFLFITGPVNGTLPTCL